MNRKEFVVAFLDAFAKDLTKQQKRKLGLNFKPNGDYRGGGYLWNIFASGSVPCFEGDEARAKYNEADKTDAFQIQYDTGIGYGDEQTEYLSPPFMTAEKLDLYGYPEFYIIGKDFSWCYVITHEGDLDGPYFAYRPSEQ